jgi:predicted enzyme related to lactoylglutathione lyase
MMWRAALRAVKRAGGGGDGDIVSLVVAGAGIVTLVYATDPQGNIIELQNWSREMGVE